MISKSKETKESEKTPARESLLKRGRRGPVPAKIFSAQEKAQVVLAIWMERIKPAEACRQMGVNWITLQQWQDRAMEGMLQALETRVNLSQGAVLPARLQALLESRQRKAGVERLQKRLEQLSEKAGPEGGNAAEP